MSLFTPRSPAPRRIGSTGLLVLLAGALLVLAGCWEEKTNPPGTAPNTAALPPIETTPLDPERQEALRTLHEHCVQAFVDQPGFGASRMGPLHQPGQYPKTFSLPADQYPYPIASRNPDGTGPDRPGATWQVVKLELIGLANHPDPVVFPSGAPAGFRPKVSTRPPDEFERTALVSLRKGSPVEYQAEADAIRMVGAIRTQAKCMQCHKDAKDDLLGAFSYVLRPEEKPGQTKDAATVQP